MTTRRPKRGAKPAQPVSNTYRRAVTEHASVRKSKRKAPGGRGEREEANLLLRADRKTPAVLASVDPATARACATRVAAQLAERPTGRRQKGERERREKLPAVPPFGQGGPRGAQQEEER